MEETHVHPNMTIGRKKDKFTCFDRYEHDSKKARQRYDDRKPVFRIRNILMRIRIRGSASGMMDPEPGPVQDPDPT